MLEAEADHPTQHKRIKICIGETRNHDNFGEHVQNIEHIRIGNQGQVNKLFDFSGFHQRDDLIVLSFYFFVGGMWRPLLSKTSLVFDEHVCTAVATKNDIECHAQPCDESDIVGVSRPLGQL